MTNIQPAVANQPTILPSSEPISGSEAPSRPNSVLASILESLTPSRTGCAFHVMSNGRLARRGVVLHDNLNTYTVSFCDVFGMPFETKKISKERATSWHWFVDVQHSNVAYDRLFGVQ